MAKNLSKSFFTSLPTVKDTVSKETISVINQNIRVTLPAIVVNVEDYPSSQCIDVQPLIGSTYTDGDYYKSPKIKKVFVKMNNAGTFKETYPIKVDDIVTLHWTHKDLNSYLNLSDKKEFSFPDEDDRWELNDVYATVGFGTRSDNQSPDPDNYVFKTENGDYSLVITPSGNVTEDSVNKIVNNETSVENNNSSTVNTSTREENSTEHNINTDTFTVKAPQSTVDGLLDITGVTSAPIFQGVIQGVGGGNANSDKEFSATKLHAGDGATGTVVTQSGVTLVFVDGICVSIS